MDHVIAVERCWIVIVSYHSLWREHLHVALWSHGCRVSTLARKLHRWLSMSGIATLLKNGAMKPFGSSWGDCCDVQLWEGNVLASSCLVLSLEIIHLLQMRWVQIIFEYPLCIGRCLGTKVMKSRLAVTELEAYFHFPLHLHGMFNKYRHD